MAKTASAVPTVTVTGTRIDNQTSHQLAFEAKVVQEGAELVVLIIVTEYAVDFPASEASQPLLQPRDFELRRP